MHPALIPPALVPMAGGGLIVTIIILILIVVLVIVAISMYNSLVRLKNQVQESWNQVDVELQRRYDLIPNLVETVKGYAGHERNTLEEVVRLRNQAAALAGGGHQLPSQERANVEQQLSQAVSNLFVTMEAYPELKSDASFRELQHALTETEDRIAAGRRFFNANVGAYNTKLESFPTNMLAKFGKFEKANYFEVTQQEVRQSQRIDFGTMSQVGPTGSQLQAQQQGVGQIPAQTYQSAYPSPAPSDPGQQGPWANRPPAQAAPAREPYNPNFDQPAQLPPAQPTYGQAGYGQGNQGQNTYAQPNFAQQPNQGGLQQPGQNDQYR